MIWLHFHCAGGVCTETKTVKALRQAAAAAGRIGQV